MAAMHRRLAKELPQLRTKTLLRDGLAVEDGHAECKGATGRPPMTRFVALLAGPRDSPYEGGVFRLQVAVPPQYPLEPPSIRFETRIFHPNVGRGHTPGAICLDILRKEAWSPALTLERTLLSIASLLADPNPASPMDSEAARLYENNRPAYDRRVREWVRMHAAPTGSKDAWAGDFGGGGGREEPAKGGVGEGRPASTAGGAVAAGAPVAAGAGGPASAAGRAAAAGAPLATSRLQSVVIDLSDDEEGDDPASKRLRPA